MSKNNFKAAFVREQISRIWKFPHVRLVDNLLARISSVGIKYRKLVKTHVF